MINLRSDDEIEKLHTANRIVKEVLVQLEAIAKPGVSTAELDCVAERLTSERGATPAFKGYRGFPKCLCTSINDEVVHGIPSEKRRLKEGDLLKIDFGVAYQGYYGDSARTVLIGTVTAEAKRLAKVTQEALYKGIEKAVAGNTISDISTAVQEYVETNGFSVVREFVGHGIGTSPHEEPPVPNFYSGKKGPVLKPGMILATEPMVNAKGYEVKVLDDKWTVVTRDGGLSAHFEHSVAIRADGPLVLSL